MHLTGKKFEHVDKRIVSLRLVQHGLTDAALFDPSGEPMIPQDVLYKKNVLMLRGRFKSVSFDFESVRYLTLGPLRFCTMICLWERLQNSFVTLMAIQRLMKAAFIWTTQLSYSK